MIAASFRRIFRAGLTNVWRNSFVSLAAIFVMTMTLTLLGALMFLSAIISNYVAYLENKVDINVYFVENADEKIVLDLKATLEKFPDVAAVTYTSQEDVFANFKAEHEGNQIIAQSLDLVGGNPFGAELSIKAKETSQYESIARFLDDYKTNSPDKVIDDINYMKNKAVIDQLTAATTYAERFGLMVILVFLVASVMITFNTIRLAIYTAREEISVMRLVGATNMYIRGPFVVEGTIYGVVAAILSLLLLAPLAYMLRDVLSQGLLLDLFAYYITHLPYFALVLIAVGAPLGALSSFLAVRKYLTI